MQVNFTMQGYQHAKDPNERTATNVFNGLSILCNVISMVCYGMVIFSLPIYLIEYFVIIKPTNDFVSDSLTQLDLSQTQLDLSQIPFHT